MSCEVMLLEPTRVRFHGPVDFQRELKRRVSAYFDETGKSQRDAGRMYLKSAVILGVTLTSYLLLVFVADAWWQVPFLAFFLAAGMAGIGVAVQHDANHGGYSDNPRVNRLFGMTLDLIGASSYVWYWKHNIVHHTYTNISGVDVDVDFQPMLRLALDNERHWYHRYQHLYAWILYGLMAGSWHFWADYRDLKNGHVGGNPFPRPSKAALAAIFLGKAIFYSWAFVIPLFFHPVWVVLTVYAMTVFVLGLILTPTFQLAHCVDEAEVIPADPAGNPIEISWAEHQVRTTADFATSNRFLTWYLGGLNFQVEHHLFPKICHVHYPALAKIVAETCREFEIPYQANPTLRSALASHVNRLYTYGRFETVPEPVA